MSFIRNFGGRPAIPGRYASASWKAFNVDSKNRMFVTKEDRVTIRDILCCIFYMYSFSNADLKTPVASLCFSVFMRGSYWSVVHVTVMPI